MFDGIRRIRVLSRWAGLCLLQTSHSIPLKDYDAPQILAILLIASKLGAYSCMGGGSDAERAVFNVKRSSTIRLNSA
jgi:hypothetical protein